MFVNDIFRLYFDEILENMFWCYNSKRPFQWINYLLCVHITFLINLFPKYCLIFNNTLRLLKVFIFAKKYWLKFQGDGISEAFCANQFLVKCPQYFVRCVDKNCPLDDAPRHMDGENRLFTKLNTIAKIKTDTFHFYLVSRSLNKINWKDGAIPKSEYYQHWLHERGKAREAVCMDLSSCGSRGGGE